MKKFELTKDAVDQLATTVKEAKMALAASQEYIQYLEDQVAEHSYQLLAKDAEAANDREPLSKLECQVTSLSADVQQVQALYATGMDLLKGIKTALALKEKASQQGIWSYVK